MGRFTGSMNHAAVSLAKAERHHLRALHHDPAMVIPPMVDTVIPEATCSTSRTSSSRPCLATTGSDFCLPAGLQPKAVRHSTFDAHLSCAWAALAGTRTSIARTSKRTGSPLDAPVSMMPKARAAGGHLIDATNAQSSPDTWSEAQRRRVTSDPDSGARQSPSAGTPGGSNVHGPDALRGPPAAVFRHALGHVEEKGSGIAAAASTHFAAECLRQRAGEHDSAHNSPSDTLACAGQCAGGIAGHGADPGATARAHGGSLWPWLWRC